MRLDLRLQISDLLPGGGDGKAPAMKRRGGCSWFEIVMSARASFAGSPDCCPFWAFRYSTSGPLRSS